VSIKGDHERDPFLLPRVRDGLANDLLVTEMHAVEHANRDANLARSGIEFLSSVDDSH
jgi:hypothetical protein